MERRDGGRGHAAPDAPVLDAGSASERAVSGVAAHQLQHLRSDAAVLCSRFNPPGAELLNADSCSCLIPGISARLELLHCTRRARKKKKKKKSNLQS